MNPLLEGDNDMNLLLEEQLDEPVIGSPSGPEEVLAQWLGFLL